MEFSFKKFFWVLAVLVALVVYIRMHYSYQDVLALTKKKPDLPGAPAMDYYVGMAYYVRGDYDHAVGAFNQLLTDYATCYYTPRGLLRLGSSYEEMRRFAEARETYERYLERFPEGADQLLVRAKYDVVKFKN